MLEDFEEDGAGSAAGTATVDGAATEGYTAEGDEPSGW